jgi:probable HAF family extracellular repeat protein
MEIPIATCHRDHLASNYETLKTRVFGNFWQDEPASVGIFRMSFHAAAFFRPSFPRAFGINNLGMIVGDYSDAAGLPHGYLFSNGSYTPIDVPGAVQTVPYGINDAGDIVGYYTDGRGVTHGFLATSVPEPSSLVLLGIGVLSLVGFAWRRQWRTA